MRIGIVGLGMIGGSIAKSFKNIESQNNYIVAYDTDATVLQIAYNEGVIDKMVPALGSDFSGCHIIFICTPTDAIYDTVCNLIPYISKDCILTDMSHAKYELITKIDAVLEQSGKQAYFIGGYPMTGSFTTGYHLSKAFLFENAYYLLAPSNNTPDFIVFILQKTIERLGAFPFVLSPSYHDFTLATISHLPRIIASSLIHLIKVNDSEHMPLHTLAASGFKELTRIADLDPELWQQICLTNKDQIVKIIKRYIMILRKFADDLEHQDPKATSTFFSEAKSYRHTLADGIHDDLLRVYTLYIEAKDESGVLAHITMHLSLAQINIKDIGIINHREISCGAIRISFSSKSDLLLAYQTLTDKGYSVYF